MDSANRPQGARRTRLLWVGRIALAVIFLGAAGAKVFGVPQMVELFDRIGFGQWFRYLTATLEGAGALLLLTPRGGILGAALLAAIMVGAAITNIALGLNPIGAVVLLVAAVALGWALRRS